MNKELTNSQIDRQNILNNPLAIEKIQEHIGISGMLFEGVYWFTTKMLADFYDVDVRTVKRYLDNHSEELRQNGYQVLKGSKLKAFKEQFGHIIAGDLSSFEQRDINVPLLDESPINSGKANLKMKELGIFDFRAFLNLGMLLVESDRAKELRSRILDIVLDTIHQKLGGSTKYINQRDEDFFLALLKEPTYRKDFTSALNDCLAMGNYKYAVYTDKIYKAIFKENAKQYKIVLQLEEKENPRDTMYSEVLTLIASFETGLAHEIRKQYENKKKKLTPDELNKIFDEYTEHPSNKPLIENARAKMASRDYALRDIIHESLEEYRASVSEGDFQRFLGEKSKSLEERINENIDVFKRLKDR